MRTAALCLVALCLAAGLASAQKDRQPDKAKTVKEKPQKDNAKEPDKEIGPAGFILGCGLFLLLPLLYFLPVAVAIHKGHDRVFSVMALTFFFAWTGVGWLVAMFYATNPYRCERR